METLIDKALALFFKVPEQGKVKTRLAKKIGEEKALLIYKGLLKKTIQVVEIYCDSAKVEPFGFYEGLLSKEVLTFFSSLSRWRFYPQRGQTLGERLKNAGIYLFKKGFKRLIFIGADCPFIKATHLERAFRFLERHSVVIIPSEDGGYVLLGLTYTLGDKLSIIFDDLPFETSELLNQTLIRLKNKSLSHVLMPPLYDIDTFDDYVRYRYEWGIKQK